MKRKYARNQLTIKETIEALKMGHSVMVGGGAYIDGNGNSPHRGYEISHAAMKHLHERNILREVARSERMKYNFFGNVPEWVKFELDPKAKIK
jgi:hypothetical protein